jgi:hypothetical protein
VPADADPSEVARQIVRVIDMPFGKRPFRVHVDPSQDDAEVDNAVADRMSRKMYRNIGLGRCCHRVTTDRELGIGLAPSGDATARRTLPTMRPLSAMKRSASTEPPPLLAIPRKWQRSTLPMARLSRPTDSSPDTTRWSRCTRLS